MWVLVMFCLVVLSCWWVVVSWVCVCCSWILLLSLVFMCFWFSLVMCCECFSFFLVRLCMVKVWVRLLQVCVMFVERLMCVVWLLICVVLVWLRVVFQVVCLLFQRLKLQLKLSDKYLIVEQWLLSGVGVMLVGVWMLEQLVLVFSVGWCVVFCVWVVVVVWCVCVLVICRLGVFCRVLLISWLSCWLLSLVYQFWCGQVVGERVMFFRFLFVWRVFVGCRWVFGFRFLEVMQLVVSSIVEVSVNCCGQRWRGGKGMDQDFCRLVCGQLVCSRILVSRWVSVCNFFVFRQVISLFIVVEVISGSCFWIFCFVLLRFRCR